MWRPTALIRHALLGIISEPIRSAILTVLLIAIFGSLVWSDADLLHRLHWEENQRVKDGVNIVIASAPGSIDAGLCERLATQPGFLHSGSLRDTKTRVLASDRSTLIPSAAMSMGFLDLLETRLPTAADKPGVFVGEALGKHLDLPPGSIVELSGQGSPRVLGVIKEGGRSSLISGWMLGIEPASGKTDHCWAETERGLRPTGENIMRSLFTADPPVEFTTLNDADPDFADLTFQYDTRLAAQLTWPLIGGITLIAALITYARRSETGLYRALNMRFWDIAFITEVEWIIYTLPALIISFSLTAVITFFRWSGVDDTPLLWNTSTVVVDTMPIAAIVLIAPTLAASLWRTNPAEALKDR
ncbi:MAG: hypothetical protein LBV00_11385 [Propionibacteriaceae bacterium]|jgi:hypothetical protein|nr:hypothetical protein [Propionibacteriaceae bacterium]